MGKCFFKNLLEKIRVSHKRVSSLYSMRMFCLEPEFTEEELCKIFSYFTMIRFNKKKITFRTFKAHVECVLHQEMKDEQILRLIHCIRISQIFPEFPFERLTDSSGSVQ